MNTVQAISAAAGKSTLVERRASALWITFNRPEVFNSLTPDMVEATEVALAQALEDDEVKSVVITGAGKAFCAGADLKATRAGFGGDDPEEATARFVETALALTNRIEQFAKPVIGAVNGIALAGGLEVVLACDLVIAAESARLGDAHANYGLVPGAGSSVRLPLRIGISRAKYLLFTGDFLPARQLEAWGLVNEVVPDDELVSAVDELTAKIATKSPVGIRRMKRLVQDGLDQPTDLALRAEQVVSQLHAYSVDRNEGLAAFSEKRKPRFIGK